MRVASLTSALAAISMVTFCGCLLSEDSSPAHALLITPDLSACEPHVCEVDGDPYSEFNEWTYAQVCWVDAPAELYCRMKSQSQGTDWPQDAEAMIEAASIAAGGFTESQKAALRCLAWMEPGENFNVSAHVAGSGSPSGLTLELQLILPGDIDAVADEFFARLGPYIGTAFGVTSEYDLETKVTRTGDGDINIRVTALSYKGITLQYDYFFQTHLEPIQATEPEPGRSCEGRYMMTYGDGHFDRRLADARTDESGRLSIEAAVQSILDDCDGKCWALADPTASTWMTPNGVVFELKVGCPSHCPDEPYWTCTYTVHAYTGDVLSSNEDCCVDCWDFTDQ